MDVVLSLRAIVGNDGVLDAKETATRAAGVMRFDTLVAQALVRPKTTEQVSAVVRWCNDNGLRVVTHGGLTGLVHGADAGPGDVILSLERMRAIESIDPQQRTATVQQASSCRRCRKPSTRSNWRSRSISARAGPRRSAAMPQPMPAATASFATA